ncbi:hypothetical protein LTR64_000536 [Lithohypha guttulata]|uniref:uncharacterized protein n=1 Tax=Lithohypha guttulata TaxID=1690604 RepID=UPI002DE0BB33|nr:hypothetical protein LTR51_005697 [Lithohypha guttulata]
MEISLLPKLPNVVGLAILLWLTYHIFIYPFFISPLRHIPRAHWTVPIPYIGSLWILHQRFRSRNNATTAQAHHHGPVVRLADNEISVNCYEGGIKTIYAGGWEKHEWYPRQFANFGVMNMFSTVGHTPHAQKKRIMANIYSKSHLQNSAQVQANSHELLFGRFLPLLQSFAESGESVEIHEVNNAFTMDFMTAYQFGIARSSNFTQNVEVRRKYLHLYHSRRDWQFISSELPPLVRKMLQRIGVSLYPPAVHQANAWLEEWSKNMCDAADEYLKLLQTGATTASAGHEPLVFKQYKTGLVALRKKDPMAGLEVHPHLDEGMNFTRGLKNAEVVVPNENQTLLEVYSDMVDQLAAGHETSGIALTYLYYELSKHPDMQDRLFAEVSNLEPRIQWPPASSVEDMSLPTAKDIDNLTYLNALIMEVLRLHAPIPGMQPRITPSTPGGVSLGPPNTQHHYTGLPSKIRVSAMPYTLHKIPSVFTDPERFNPDRWLPEHTSEAQMTEMNRHFWAFGSGGRKCIGMNLALQEIKLIVAAVWGNWKTEIVDDEGIEEVDAYTTRPSSGRLVVRVEKR